MTFMTKQTPEINFKSVDLNLEILKSIPQAYFLCDSGGNIISSNDKLHEILNGTREEYLNLKINEISEVLANIIAQPWDKIPVSMQNDNWSEIYFKTLNGQSFDLDVNIKKRLVNGEEFLLVCLWDNSKKKSLYKKKIASKKVEALGTLSGGIAHEYNNLLMVIGGYIQKSIRELEGPSPIKERLEKANLATQRATILSKQLLIFSGKHAREHKITNLSNSLLELRSTIEQDLPNNVILNFSLDDKLAKSELDPKQFKEAILNIVQNSVEAMPMGGIIDIEESSVVIEPNTMFSLILNIIPDEYVVINITDTGVGIDTNILDDIFDPFFTTKTSSSSGLGLAVVFGYMKASGGYINVNSVIDEGTTIQLFFKKTTSSVNPTNKDNKDIPHGNGETILVVDDEEEILNIVSENLESIGYKVITANDGIEGLEVEKEYEGKVDLVLSDVVMPGFTGPEMIRALVKETPNLKYIFMSGFAPQKDNSRTKLPEGATLLAKPVELTALAQECHKILNDNNYSVNAVKGETND